MAQQHGLQPVCVSTQGMAPHGQPVPHRAQLPHKRKRAGCWLVGGHMAQPCTQVPQQLSSSMPATSMPLETLQPSALRPCIDAAVRAARAVLTSFMPSIASPTNVCRSPFSLALALGNTLASRGSNQRQAEGCKSTADALHMSHVPKKRQQEMRRQRLPPAAAARSLGGVGLPGAAHLDAAASHIHDDHILQRHRRVGHGKREGEWPAERGWAVAGIRWSGSIL